VTAIPPLDLSLDVVALTAALVDAPSESHHDGPLADAVEAALRPLPHLQVRRLGNSVVASTSTGAAERVVIGGHLDTVPSSGNIPHRLDGDRLYGLGSCDMKGGVAVMLRAAHEVREPARDVTYVFYENEEIEERFNGLKRLVAERPEWVTGDFAILMEPSDAGVEAGCQGTMRVEVRTRGVRAHSARSWRGDNAIHKAGQVLARLAAYEPAVVEIDGLEYREGLSAVLISGGVAGNVIPDECVVTVNYRFAPSVSAAQAETHVREVFEGFEVDVVDLAVGAMPGLDRAAVRDFLAAVDAVPRPKFGWTDVARFSGIGVPAVNFGPGDPSYAHARDEHVPVAQLREVEARLLGWLRGA
jgi:succinyl-diaminopimelate desuccinylase